MHLYWLLDFQEKNKHSKGILSNQKSKAITKVGYTKFDLDQEQIPKSKIQ